MTLFEVNAAGTIRKTAHPGVNILFGAVNDETMADKMHIMAITTGFDGTT
jgi:cell division GTPase FtsZ